MNEHNRTTVLGLLSVALGRVQMQNYLRNYSPKGKVLVNNDNKNCEDVAPIKNTKGKHAQLPLNLVVRSRNINVPCN